MRNCLGVTVAVVVVSLAAGAALAHGPGMYGQETMGPGGSGWYGDMGPQYDEIRHDGVRPAGNQSSHGAGEREESALHRLNPADTESGSASPGTSRRSPAVPQAILCPDSASSSRHA